MRGFSSCSLSQDEALRFAINNLSHDKIPVLFIIKWPKNINRGHFVMNKDCYTLFPDEAETLIIDGCTFIVESVDQNAVVQYQGLKIKITKIVLKRW